MVGCRYASLLALLKYRFKSCLNKRTGHKREIMIRKLLYIILITAGGKTWTLAQATNFVEQNAAWHSADTVPHPLVRYDQKTPPILTLPEAYVLALRGLGTETNQYYCVSATCLAPVPNGSNIGLHGEQGWTFVFSNTNGSQRQALVYFDRATLIEPPPPTNGPGQLF